MNRLEITLFGALRVQKADEPLSQFPRGKIKHLFAYLLLNRHAVHPREQLAGLFWGEEDDHRARHCLNTALWRLNRILAQSGPRAPSYLRIDAQNIGFNTASDFWLDIEEFESRCTLAEQIGPDAPEKQAALYRQAVACYRGDLLVDCYEDWCLVERERFRCLYLRALRWLHGFYAARRAYDDALDCARRILAYDPLREDVHRDVIELYLTINCPADALRQYRICEGLLARELAVEPMPETRILLNRIIGATAPAATHALADTLLVDSPTESTLQQKLDTATARLHEAAGTLDRGRIQLQEAATLIEEVMSRMGSATPASTKQLEHAAVLLDIAMQNFGHARRGTDHRTPLAAS